MEKLTPQEREMLWGEDEPYSEAKLILNTRILGGAVTRVMVEVQGHINPTTFRLVKKRRHKEFAQDIYIQNMLDHAEYWGKKDGYVVAMSNEEEYCDDPLVMTRAEAKLRVLKEALLRMHEFVLDYLDDEE